MYRVSLVNINNPEQVVPFVIVEADNWRDALRAAEKDNQGCMAVEAERVTPIFES